MGFFKNVIIGVVVYQAVKFLTKKGVDGKTKIDEIKEKAPEWMEKAKSFGEDLKSGKTFERY